MNSSKHGCGWKPDRLACGLATGEGHADGRRTVGNDELSTIAFQGLTQLGEAGGRRGRGVGLDEDRVAQGDFKVVEPVADQRLKVHGIDVAGLDALENLIVEIDGLFLWQPQQYVAEAAVGITAVELEVNLAEVKAAAEVGAAGPALDGVVIGFNRRRPVTGTLLVEAALEHSLRIIVGSGRGARRRIAAVTTGGRVGPGE